jgi:hypothetical protein
MKITSLFLLLFALAATAVYAAEPSSSPLRDPRSLACPASPDLATGMNGLEMTSQSQPPGQHQKKGGSGTSSLALEGDPWSFYCYSDPYTIYGCLGTSEECQAACERTCNGHCDWDET